MARETRATLGIEALEGRSLLSGITYSLTTEQSVYQVGQPIQFTFTETNTSDQPVPVSLSPTDFTVSYEDIGSQVWQSDPGNAGQPPTSVTLQPGQSVSQSATWDGTTMETGSEQGQTGSYAVNEFGAFQVSNPNAPQGDMATFQITDPLQDSLTTNQATYQMGQPIQIIYSLINTSDYTITVPRPDPVFSWSLGDDGGTFGSELSSYDDSYCTIAPGQSYTTEFSWNPLSYIGELYTLANLTGTFTATASPQQDLANNELSVKSQVQPPAAGTIVSSITTDQTVYQPGQTVTMTFTETNEGDQPVAVPTAQNGFVVTASAEPPSNDALPVFPGDYINFYFGADGSDSNTTPGTVLWTTLQPGQSLTQTATWTAADLESGTTTYTIINISDLNGDTAVFEVSSEPLVSGTAQTQGSGNDASSTSSSQIAPLVNASVVTNQTEYQPGQKVRVTLTIPGSDPANVALPGGKGHEQITVLDGTQVVSRLNRRVPTLTLRHLDEGRTVKLTKIWNGRPNQSGVHELKPGNYTIDVAYGDYAGSSVIAIGRKSS
jgi:Intracellular proteinase inhibitor